MLRDSRHVDWTGGPDAALARSGCPIHAQHEWGFSLSRCQPRTFPQARSRLSIDRPILVCYYALKIRVSLARMLLRPARRICSLTTEYPMKDASPEERSDEGSLLSFVTPFDSYPCALFHFPYTLFFAPNSLPSIGCALFRKTRGVGINSSQSGTLAPSSTNHESQVTNHE